MNSRIISEMYRASWIVLHVKNVDYGANFKLQVLFLLLLLLLFDHYEILKKTTKDWGLL